MRATSTSTSTGENIAESEPPLRLRLIIVHSPDRTAIGRILSGGTVGRDGDSDNPITDDRLSRRHGSLDTNGAAWTDLGSRNGSWLNGERRTGQVSLEPGDVLRFGDTLGVVDAVASADDARVQELTGPSKAMAGLRSRVGRYAATDLTIFLMGQTGTGKEVIARALHRLSGRTGAFVPVNCGGITSSLAQSQLFGHRRGAFTGAVADQKGCILEADRGTLFLDELGELPPPEQAMLLRVLQDRVVVPVGGGPGTRVDFRLICATNVDLPSALTEGRFREDLFHRVRDVPIETVPLRERRTDILSLYYEFRGPDLTTEAAQALLLHDWPGNARELRSASKRLSIDSAGQPATLSLVRGLSLMELPPGPRTGPVKRDVADTPSRAPVTKAAIVEAIAKEGGNRAAAARRLGIGRATLYRYLDEEVPGE